jgi:2-polyprenyl-3-methyl-5-hydroxy-6-metoxy-1,4-benzoquinol methylase
MSEAANYIEINKALWNQKTSHHVASDFYNVKAFVEGENSLKDIELELLGDVRGKSILHLQCHFGQDTLSLARMGTKVTGMDFSEEAIAQARVLAQQLELDAEFICCNVYDLPQHLDKQFDIVFASYGVIGWLPDMQEWARVVSRFVRPGGMFLFVEFHPVVWMFSYDFSMVEYSYFNKEAIIETMTGTYAEPDAPIQAQEIGWNHSMAEVMQSLIDAGLRVDALREYDYSPCNCFKNTVEVSPGKYQVRGMEGKLPMVYAVRATK